MNIDQLIRLAVRMLSNCDALCITIKDHDTTIAVKKAASPAGDGTPGHFIIEVQ